MIKIPKSLNKDITYDSHQDHDKTDSANHRSMIQERTPQVLTGSSLATLINLLSIHKIDRPFWSKLPSLIFWSTLLTPLYWLENILFLTKLEYPVHPEPVFIIGHWRSGTTYLHYLMAKDKQFGYCSNADAFMPGALLTGRWFTRKILSMRLPKTRPMDDVKMHVDAPQEEEFAMMLLTPILSYYNFVFPRSFKELLLNSLVFNPNDHAYIDGWRNQYFHFIKKLSFRCKGKRLLLKNPANTARITHLIRIFPKAKFIYLHRDPAEVRLSTLRMVRSMTKINALQEFPDTDLEEEIKKIHRAVLNEYETQRQSIGPGKLIEIEYSDLITDPLFTVKRIYGSLKISGFEASQPDFKKFIEEQKTYVPHQYQARSVKS